MELLKNLFILFCRPYIYVEEDAFLGKKIRKNLLMKKNPIFTPLFSQLVIYIIINVYYSLLLRYEKGNTDTVLYTS